MTQELIKIMSYDRLTINQVKKVLNYSEFDIEFNAALFFLCEALYLYETSSIENFSDKIDELDKAQKHFTNVYLEQIYGKDSKITVDFALLVINKMPLSVDSRLSLNLFLTDYK